MNLERQIAAALAGRRPPPPPGLVTRTRRAALAEPSPTRAPLALGVVLAAAAALTVVAVRPRDAAQPPRRPLLEPGGGVTDELGPLEQRARELHHAAERAHQRATDALRRDQPSRADQSWRREAELTRAAHAIEAELAQARRDRDAATTAPLRRALAACADGDPLCTILPPLAPFPRRPPADAGPPAPDPFDLE